MSVSVQSHVRELLKSPRPSDLLEAIRLIKTSSYPSAFLTHLIALQVLYVDDAYAVVRQQAAEVFEQLAPHELRDFLRSVAWKADLMLHTESRERYLRHLTAHPMVERHTLGRLALHWLGGDINFYIRARMLQAEEALQAYCLGGTFYMYNTSIESLPDEIGNLSQLNCLLLPNNRLKQLPNSIGLLSQIYTMDLQNNQLESLPDSIKYMHKLRTLELSNNRLHVLPPEIGELHQLRRLCLYSNKMRVLSYTIQWLEHLECLDLGRNPNLNFFQSIEYLKYCPRLRTLSLRGNQLHQLLPNLAELSSLEHLDLSENPHLPIEAQLQAIAQKPMSGQLKSLKLDHMGLSQLKLPQSISQSLKELSLVGNTIGSLHSAFAHIFPSLEVLDLSENQVSELSDLLTIAPQLLALNVSNTGVEYMPRFPNLTTLILDGNDLFLQTKNGWDQLSAMPRLRVLSIRGVQLQKQKFCLDLPRLNVLCLDDTQSDDWACLLQHIGARTHIERLSLAGVDLQAAAWALGNLEHVSHLCLERLPAHTDWDALIDALVQLPRLSYLSLAHNPHLHILPTRLASVSRLRYLDISFTGIKQLPKALSSLKSLEKIRIDGTPNLLIQNLQNFSYDWFTFKLCEPMQAVQSSQIQWLPEYILA